MKTIIIIFIFTVVMMLQGAVFAVEKSTGPSAFCPDISQIKKNQMTQKWRAQTQVGTWKSYQTSFATNLTHFVGAQWVGEAVGQLTCVYKAEQQFTMQGNLTIQPELPVMLVFHSLVYQPSRGKWKRSGQGVYNCYSYHQKNCSFKIRAQQHIQNIYQEAESLKTTNASAIQPESY